MSEDATLDAFGGGGVEPVPVTSSWDADGECESCGASAPRRWLDGTARVCADCVAWTTSGGGA